MKQKLLLFACTLFSTMLFSQAVPMAFEDWKTTSGTMNFYYKSTTKTDASGNVYVAGATLNSSGNTDILLAKYNSSGVQLWIQQYAGSGNGHDFAVSIAVTNTCVIITGAVTNNTLTPETDAITMKYSSSGSLLWSTVYTGAGGSFDSGKDIVIDASGNSFVTGGTYNTSGNSDILFVKYNASGTQQWASTYDYTFHSDDVGAKVTISGSSATVVGPVTSSTGHYKVSTRSYAQSTGSLVTNGISFSATAYSITAVTDLVTDASGNYYIVGSTSVSGQGENIYVQKINSSLTSLWTYTYNATSNLDDIARAVQVDASGNVYISGVTTHSTQGKNLIAIKLNSSGANQWTQTSTFTGDDEAADMVLDASANIYLGGYKTNGLTNKDYYTTKYNTSGTKQWEIEMDSKQLNDYITNIAIDSLNNIITTGQTEVSTGVFQFTTVRYVQKDVITPTDFNGETPNPNYMFFANTGQIVDTNFTSVSGVRFYTHCTKPSFYFKSYSQSYVFSKIDTVRATVDTIHRIDLSFNNCNKAETYPMEEQKDGYLNYFMGYLPEKVANVKGNKRLITPNLYNNIDLMTSSNQNGIKYYFIVKPGGNLSDIKLEYTGATSYSLNGSTNALSINSSIGSITFDKPVAYQLTSANATVAVTSFSPTWTTNGTSNKYKFNTGAYTSSLTLIIEVDQGNSAAPPVTTAPNIEWSTNFGSSGFDAVTRLTYGSSNNLFLIGDNSTAILPQGVGVLASQLYQSGNNGLSDGYVAKFDQTGKLLWRTYVGGSGQDNLRGITIAGNGTGDLYCVGITKSVDLLTKTKAGTTVNHATHAVGANNDGFIFQLNQNGLANTWLTYYGGTGEDILTNCKFDSFGNLFIVGQSTSSSLAVVGTSPQYTSSYIDVYSDYDGYVMKLNNSSFNIDWATYIASSDATSGNCSEDYIEAMAFDANQNLFIGGNSTGTNYPILHPTGSTTAAAKTNCLGDGVVTQFSNTGEMLWSTYIPSDGTDGVTTLIVDGRDLYVGGYTNSTTTFPTKFSGLLYANTTKSVTPTSAYQESGFFAYFNYLNHLEHLTLIGGDDGDDYVQDIALDAVHNIYLVGWTTSTSLDQPSVGNPVNTWSETNKGNHDEFIFTIKNGTTDVIWSTQVGGANDDDVASVVIDGNNKLFLAGTMSSIVNFPWNDGGGYPVHFQGALTGGQNDYDGCITRLKLSNVNYVGIKEYTTLADGIFLYPNPTQGSLTVRLTDVDQKKNFTIFNTMGQAISSGTLLSGLTTINVANLAEGIYFIEITDKTTKATAKFIKQ